MAQFKSLAEIQAYIQRNTHQVLRGSAQLERVLADTMSKAVVDTVYAVYDPKDYIRRENNYGLSDPRNMIVSDVLIESNGQVRLIFENITEGNDTLVDDMLVDTIEEGIWDNWMAPNTPYADSRKFVEETANRIKQNPSEVINAIKAGLRDVGMRVKG